MVYDISSPTSPEFVQWANNRDYTIDVHDVDSGDFGPEEGCSSSRVKTVRTASRCWSLRMK
jgi:hypothetical protein